MTPARAHRVPPNRVLVSWENLTRDMDKCYTCLSRALRAHDLPVQCTADIPLWVLEDGNNLLRPLNYYIKPTLRDELGRVDYGQFILHITNPAYLEDENDIVDHCEAVKTFNGNIFRFRNEQWVLWDLQLFEVILSLYSVRMFQILFAGPLGIPDLSSDLQFDVFGGMDQDPLPNGAEQPCAPKRFKPNSVFAELGRGVAAAPPADVEQDRDCPPPSLPSLPFGASH